MKFYRREDNLVFRWIEFYLKYMKSHLIVFGFIMGIIVSISFHTIKEHTRYITYATFYLQEKGGIRPASIKVNFPVKTENDLERLEQAIITKYDNPKLTDVMLFGSLIILER